MSRLELSLFGSPRLARDDQALEFDARKTMALLAYLAVTGERYGRETLLALLWPELELRRAQNVLRRNLSQLNKTLGGEWIVVERDTICLDSGTNAWVDVTLFRHLTHSWQSHNHGQGDICTTCLRDLAEAEILYRADFLAGFGVRNSMNFDNWQSLESENLKRELATVLARLVQGHSERLEFDQAITYAQRWFTLDPLNEPLHRRLMELYAEKGDRSAALRQYQHCLRLLEEELGVSPELETTALYQRLRQESEQHKKIVAETFAILDGDTEVGLKNNLLGSGGMGNVYHGLNTQTGEAVAIKVLRPEMMDTNPELIERFVREGQALRQLNHPNIVKMLAATEQEGRHYLVMEYVVGGSLQDLIAREGALSVGRVLEIALDLADALTRAHRLNIIHRDLKPANILLAEDGTPRLTDFGISRILDSPQMTGTGLIIGTTNYLSPEGFAGKRLDERADIWAFGVVIFEMLTGEQPFKGDTIANTLSAILNQPVPNLAQSLTDIPAALIDLIERMLEKDPTHRIPSVRLVGAEIEAIIEDRPVTPIVPIPVSGPPPPCPYRGLSAFQEVDAPNFFGREAFTRELVDVVQKQPVATVVGPSGSGKSSVVFAGLLAQMRQEVNWIIITFRPGSDPFQSMAGVLIPYLEPDLSETDRLVETRKLAQSLGGGDLVLVDVIARIINKSSEISHLLLVADQFEELYTLCPDPEVQHRFLDVLLDIIELQQFQRHPTFSFVFTLRADFLEQALTYRPLADVIQDANLMLGPMTRDELSRAIEKPAEKVGVSFEPGLVERIQDDVGEEPGNLPLLEFALTALWEEQQARKFTHTAYEAIGRVEGALTRHADQIFTELNPGEQEAARQVFSQLVRPGVATEDTRRIARRDEIAEDDWSLVQRLADARLVITGRNAIGYETVEIIHEALIRNWGRLQEWLASDRAFRIWQERLRFALNQWQASEQDEGALLHGIPLAEAEGWLSESAENLSQVEQEFIQASINRRERRNAEQEQERLARERLRQRITVGAIVGLVIAVSLALLAGFQWQQAANEREVALEARATAAAGRDQALLALSRQLAALTETHLETRLDLALLLGLEATLIADTGEARSILRDGLASNSRLMTYLWGHSDRINTVTFSPDGRTLASGSNDNTIILWDVANDEPFGPRLTGHTDNVLSIAFSPDGQILASASADKTIIIWDVNSGQSLGSPLVGHTSGASSVVFSPDGQMLASSGDKAILLWDVPTALNSGVHSSKSLLATLIGHTDAVRSVTFSPDGQIVASGSNDETIILWDVASRVPRGTPLVGHTDWVRSVAFSPDGRTLASASENGTIILWNMGASPSLRQILEGHTSSVRSVTYSPKIPEEMGSYILASGSTDGTIILWDVTTGQPFGSPLTGHTDWVRSVAFSPDGRKLASASHDRSIILWDITSQELDPLASHPPLTSHTESVQSIAFSPDGQILASGSNDNTIILWDVANSVPRGTPLVGHTDSVRSVAFSPDGQILASGSNDETIILWDVANGLPISTPLVGHMESVQSVAFSPDGQILASGSNDNTIILWDVANGLPKGTPLVGHNEGVQSVAFSPDGLHLASAGDDKNIILWDMNDSPILDKTLKGHKDVVFSIDFSPDGKTLASSSWDKTIILWDVANGLPINTPLVGHAESVQEVAFSPDGHTLASGSWDETIMLWDIPSGLPITINPPLTGHTGSVRGVTFSPDGHILASASDDGMVILWDVHLGSWQARACSRANRNLSIIEWKQFFGEQKYRVTCSDLPAPKG